MGGRTVTRRVRRPLIVTTMTALVGLAPAGPAGAALFGERVDLEDANPDCDANLCSNRYRTFNQTCVTTGGQQV